MDCRGRETGRLCASEYWVAKGAEGAEDAGGAVGAEKIEWDKESLG